MAEIPSAMQSRRFSAIRTFMSLPFAPGAESVPERGIAIVGVPFDNAASFRPGCMCAGAPGTPAPPRAA